MTNFKFARRQATVSEIESLGFTVEGRFAYSTAKRGWYDTEKFIVITGEPCSGQVLYLDDGLPSGEESIAGAATNPGAGQAH